MNYCAYVTNFEYFHEIYCNLQLLHVIYFMTRGFLLVKEGVYMDRDILLVNLHFDIDRQFRNWSLGLVQHMPGTMANAEMIFRSIVDRACVTGLIDNDQVIALHSIWNTKKKKFLEEFYNGKWINSYWY